MYSRKIKRIYNEIKELKNSVDLFKESGIYFHINDEDLENIIHVNKLNNKLSIIKSINIQKCINWSNKYNIEINKSFNS